jgi:hypothetical protein
MSAMQMENNQSGAPGQGSYPAPGTQGQRWAPPVGDPFGTRRKSPALAAFLSAMPGLGQIYVGYYIRGFIHILVVASTITLIASGARHGMDDFRGGGLETAPLLGLFLSFFWLYNMIDAWRIANLYNEAILSAGSGNMRKEIALPSTGGALTGGVVLLVVGLLLFLNTMFGVSLDWLREWWPIVPIGFGVYLITQGIKDRRRRG